MILIDHTNFLHDPIAIGLQELQINAVFYHWL